MALLEQYYAWKERRRKEAKLISHELHKELKEKFYLFIRDNGLFHKNELCGNLDMNIIYHNGNLFMLTNHVHFNRILAYMCCAFDIHTKRYERLSDKWEDEANKIIFKYLIKYTKRAHINEYITLRRYLGHCKQNNILNVLYNVVYKDTDLRIITSIDDMCTFLKYKKEDEKNKRRTT
jgi:hypothetical protein